MGEVELFGVRGKKKLTKLTDKRLITKKKSGLGLGSQLNRHTAHKTSAWVKGKWVFGTTKDVTNHPTKKCKKLVETVWTCEQKEIAEGKK